MTGDILDYISAALTTPEPLTQDRVEQTIKKARQTFGGDTVYICSKPALHREKVTRRTLQRRKAKRA
ncbi:MAG: hypothetical protein KDJ34_03965 [Candidatus Competibacteraceae bacterium]|nr:hypothetical protein [Candidatus Competibacteraceae bacterium]